MNLTIASSPHIRGNCRTDKLMLDVVIALLPALAVGTWVLGPRALAVTAVSMVSAVSAEWLYSRAAGKNNTIRDCSALVTGMLLAMTLPVSVPYGIVILGSVSAIVFAKCMCGGLGQNVLNPASAAISGGIDKLYGSGWYLFSNAHAPFGHVRPAGNQPRGYVPGQNSMFHWGGVCPGCAAWRNLFDCTKGDFSQNTVSISWKYSGVDADLFQDRKSHRLDAL